MQEWVIYKDGLILVLNKPAGWASTPSGPGHHLTDVLPQLTFGKTTLPQVAHRLDRETSGCLILGRHARALRSLAELFQQGKIRKTYWAIVEGSCRFEGLYESPIEGKAAATEVKVRANRGDWTWLELHPLTGRNRQLRRHCAELGHAIRGEKTAPLMLHALEVEVPLYPKKAPLVVRAPLPGYWETYLAAEEVKK
jgi:tRNA pseudouridine32 synthase/23S rRNA pseudouridine746 synthase